MTEHTPQQAAISHPHDRHGHTVTRGDVVELVFGGDHLRGIVEEIRTDEHGVHRAHISTTVVVPASATSVRLDENPKHREREGSRVEHHKPKAKS